MKIINNKSSGKTYIFYLLAIIILGTIEYGSEDVVQIVTMLCAIVAPVQILTDIYKVKFDSKPNSFAKRMSKILLAIVLLVISYIILDNYGRRLAIYLSIGLIVIMIIVTGIFKNYRVSKKKNTSPPNSSSRQRN